jgi:glycosyltransferase involved in cell wall biosynthesis
MAGLAARLHKNVKIVHTIAGLWYLFSGEGAKPKMLRGLVGPLLKFALKHPRAQVIFQNPDDEGLMVKRGFVRSSQCHLIRGSGVDLKAFPEMPLPSGDTPLVLLPTRLVHDKGIAVFVDAARIVKAQGVNARFQIAGGVTHNNPLAISQIEMENMVADGAAEWLGKVTDMPALYQGSTLICYPSYYGEGVPKVLLEAAATGRPIITTDHAGCREAVRHGQNGLLVPIKDANACAEAIIELLSDREKCASMGSASRKIAEEIFDVRLIVKNTLSVYQTARVS